MQRRIGAFLAKHLKVQLPPVCQERELIVILGPLKQAKVNSMTIEEFKDIAQGIQAIIISVAALSGGIWALFRFGAMKEYQRAQLELENLKVESYRLSGVSADVNISHQKLSNGKYYVSAEFTFLNYGTNVVTYKCDDYPFHLNKVSIVNEKTVFLEIIRLRVESASSDKGTECRWFTGLTFFPMTPVTLSFFYEVEESGNYMLSIMLESDEVKANLREDINALNRKRVLYENHKGHPNYIKKPTNNFGVHKYHLIT